MFRERGRSDVGPEKLTLKDILSLSNDLPSVVLERSGWRVLQTALSCPTQMPMLNRLLLDTVLLAPSERTHTVEMFAILNTRGLESAVLERRV